MADLKLSKKYKKGIKEAMGGNFNEAIELFDDVFLHASDPKLQNESIIWFHICQALRYAKGGDIISGKKEYNEYLSAIESYEDICGLTILPSQRLFFFSRVERSVVRFNVWLNKISKFLLLHDKQIELLNSRK